MVKRQEVLIAVMGVTGAGKSSFVKLITGNPNVRVGHSLHAGKASSTSKFRVAIHTFSRN